MDDPSRPPPPPYSPSAASAAAGAPVAPIADLLFATGVESGTVLALSKRLGGSAVWRATVPTSDKQGHYSTALEPVADGLVLVVVAGDRATGLDAATGRVRWSGGARLSDGCPRPTVASVSRSPPPTSAAAAGFVIVAAEFCVTALRLADGAELWKVRSGRLGTRPFLVVEGEGEYAEGDGGGTVRAAKMQVVLAAMPLVGGGGGGGGVGGSGVGGMSAASASSSASPLYAGAWRAVLRLDRATGQDAATAVRLPPLERGVRCDLLRATGAIPVADPMATAVSASPSDKSRPTRSLLLTWCGPTVALLDENGAGGDGGDGGGAVRWARTLAFVGNSPPNVAVLGMHRAAAAAAVVTTTTAPNHDAKVPPDQYQQHRGPAVFVSMDTVVYRVDAWTGAVQWSRRFEGFWAGVGFAAVLCGDGVVYLGGHRQIHCLDAETGNQVWERKLDRTVRGGEHMMLATAERGNGAGNRSPGSLVPLAAVLLVS
ncbi:hypothetical protein DFJ73DRAFT_927463 [Zopfochytrium polystomum]|nr:hypothetical protein DFJ73DRAFT_927463 [Zopfochytrium polystomum]